MPGYNQTLLQGMQGLAGQAMQQRRLQDMERQQAFQQQRQYQLMQQQERNRQIQLQMQGVNQQRLWQGMQDTRTQRDLANEMRMMGLRLREGEMNRPSYNSPEDLVTEAGDPVRVMRDRKTGKSVYEGTMQPVPSSTRLLPPMKEKELQDIKGSFDEIQAATEAMAFMKGRKVEGQKGDSSATGWEGYVPEALQTLLTPDKGGILNKVTGGGLVGWMGGTPGVATRSAISALGTMKTKERSGAAVTPSEWARLIPYIPTDKDNAEVARTKLQRFITEYANMLENKMASYKSAGRPIPKPMQEFAKRALAQARLTAKGEAGLTPTQLRQLEEIYGP